MLLRRAPTANLATLLVLLTRSGLPLISMWLHASRLHLPQEVALVDLLGP